MIGDPNGEVAFTGHLTLDPFLVSVHGAPPKGWFCAIFNVITLYANGDSTIPNLFFPLFSMKNPEAPETPSYPLVASHVTVASSRRPEVQWGVTLVDVGKFLPLAPIAQPWEPFLIGTAGYGGVDLPPATYEQRADLDFHHGEVGRLISGVTQSGDINRPLLLDPSVLGSGAHRIALIRTQPDRDELAGSLLVFKMEVADGIPPDSTMVPNVIGQSLDVATQMLTDAELSAAVTVQTGPPPVNQVLSQAPGGGTVVLKDSTVALVVSNGMAPVDEWRPVNEPIIVEAKGTQRRLRVGDKSVELT
jgi:hypothetical protein